ncbi:DMT family transporter [Thalassobaculum sp.]|uniref:DMT family transporter n=1 Tax=Thalassobaculum sp. TaxID=2022740 RepID=UPI0032F09A45
MKDWWSVQSDVFKGSVCLAAAGAAFVGINAIVHSVGRTIPPFQLAFLQQVVVLLLVAPGILAKGLGVMRTKTPALHICRCLATGVAIFSGFVAMANLPVSETTALLFSRMVFTAALATWFLKEAIGAASWLRITIAGVGVILVLSPDASSLNVYGFAAIVSALAISITMLLIRAMKEETAEAIVGWQAAGLVLLFGGPAIIFWVPLDGRGAIACVSVGVLLWLAQHLNVLAYRYAAAGAIQPAEASRLVIALAIDGLLFGTIPSMTVIGGVALILMAAGFGRIVWRRRRMENA